jgi:hypothetical protein
MFIGASVGDVLPPGGVLEPVKVGFVSLTGSTSGILDVSEAPEPAAFTLIVLMLVAMGLGRLWQSRKRGLAYSTVRNKKWPQMNTQQHG